MEILEDLRLRNTVGIGERFGVFDVERDLSFGVIVFEVPAVERPEKGRDNAQNEQYPAGSKARMRESVQRGALKNFRDGYEKSS